MGVERGRDAGATIAATSIGINTATATGSTDRAAAADISIAAGSSAGPGSSTGPVATATVATDICSIDAATGTAPDTGADSCRGLIRCWELGDGQLGLSRCIDNIELGGRGLILGLIIASICARLGAVIVANKGLGLGHQRLHVVQPSLVPRR